MYMYIGDWIEYLIFKMEVFLEVLFIYDFRKKIFRMNFLNDEF